jgi:Gene product 88
MKTLLEISDQALSFGKGNAKLDKAIATFSLPAGHTCPGAKDCMAKADRLTGQITDGSNARFRCFAASGEAWNPDLRAKLWRNFDLLKGKTRAEMAELISRSLPDNSIIRIHVGGDFFSQPYFLAWCDVARSHPSVRFYAYTKSISIWDRCLAEVPANLILTASEGGRFDEQIGERKRARVVFTEEQAAALGLELDHDDSHAYNGEESFALLLHGTQAKGTPAAKALSALKLEGKGGYSK